VAVVEEVEVEDVVAEEEEAEVVALKEQM